MNKQTKNSVDFIFYFFFRVKFSKTWHCFKKSFLKFASAQNITLERTCDIFLEPLFKFVDKYTVILGQVS